MKLYYRKFLSSLLKKPVGYYFYLVSGLLIWIIIFSGCGDPGKTDPELKQTQVENNSKEANEASDPKQEEISTIDQKDETSASLWKSQAEGGDRIAQFQYSKALEKIGSSEAMTWLRRAAEQGLAEAQFELGRKFLDGVGVEKRVDDGIKWLKLSAKQNFKSAIDLLQTRFPNQIVLTKEEADQARSSFNKGLGHLLGQEGLEKDPDKAVQYFLEAAEIGSVDAQWNLGLLYNEGIGVERSGEEAKYWFEKAAKAGHARAQFNLSIMYMTGDGAEEDIDKAADYMKLSADAGFVDAAFGLAELYSVGRGVTKNLDEAVRWFKVAAEAGHPRAQSNLGTFYVEGQGVEANEQEAFNWFKKAADLGEPYGLYNLGYLYETGSQVEQNHVEAYKCYSLAAETLMKLSTDFGLPLDPLFYKASQLRDQLAERLSARELKEAVESSSRFIRQKFEENSEILRKIYSDEQNQDSEGDNMNQGEANLNSPE